MIFVFAVVDVMFYVYWLANIVPSLHAWDESHLVMVDDLFNVLLDAVCQYFAEDFSIYVLSYMGLKFSFFVISLSGLGIRMMLDS